MPTLTRLAVCGLIPELVGPDRTLNRDLFHVKHETRDWDTAAWRVRGVVQGVGFRYWARREGQRLGLHGTVRNSPDGSVEVVAAGSADQLYQFRQLLLQGPHGAIVHGVEALDPADRALPFPFEITR